MKSKVIVICLLIHLSVTAFAYQEAPKNELLCSAELFPAAYKIPLNGLLPFSVSLKGNEFEIQKNSIIETVEVIEKYRSFYSSYWIKPETEPPPGIKKLIVKTASFEKNQIWLRLTRFPASPKRVAGMALEFSVERGYYGAFLLQPEQDGNFRNIIAPVKLDNEKLNLIVNCYISPQPQNPQ